MKIAALLRFRYPSGHPLAALLLLLIGVQIPSWPAAGSLVDVRHWSSGGVTRVALETTGDFTFTSASLSRPERVFFDLEGAVPMLEGQTVTGVTTIPIADKLIRQIRVAETRPGVTRVVLDLHSEIEFSASQLSNPNRLVIELRAPGSPVPAPVASVAPQAPVERRAAGAYAKVTRYIEPAPSTPNAAIVQAKPSVPERPAPLLPLKPAPSRPSSNPAERVVDRVTTRAMRTALPAPDPVVADDPPAPQPGLLAKVTSPARELPEDLEDLPILTGASTEPKATPARSATNGNHSLIRAMGLKVGRVVIDPGHGGHDTGTISRNGLFEKDIAFDIAKRLGALIEEQMHTEVVYTRDDDRFISLAERTRIANAHKADLFISLHLNASRESDVAGTETFYLNLTNSRYSLELAAKENAHAEQTVHQLQDLVKKIALSDKLEESREFAIKMQNAMHARLGAATRAKRNRGIKQAPFMVLIGASMPSILVEIGFLSNPREESLLKQSQHRQRVAEALAYGILNYSETLSHTQVAKGYDPE